MSQFFDQVEKIRFEGPQSTNPLAFHHYNPDEIILGKRMEDHLRLAVCYWHTFCWGGTDMFGINAFDRPWQRTGDAMAQARLKAEVAFEFFGKLGAPYYCFHDTDVIPQSDTVKQYLDNMAAMTELLAQKQQQTGTKLLWGTANCFSHPR